MWFRARPWISPDWEPVIPPSDGMPDLSREGPFDVHQDASESGATSQVLDSLLGFQYRMTSYDDDADRSDLNPAYGLHLHDPRLLEYVGVPESARLLSRTPDYTGCTIWVGIGQCRLSCSCSMMRE